MLICPKCKEVLIKDEHSYSCKHHHVYDIARRGYINMFLGNHKATGDDKDMVKARTTFLSHGYYQPLCDSLKAMVMQYQPKVFVDAGCGEGYYTNQMKDVLPDSTMYGIDLSKYAVDEACKGKKDVTYVVSSVFHMPLREACVDMIVSVFAPFDMKENKRILKENGFFIKVGPAPKHLYALKQILYDEVYDNEEKQELYEGMTCIHKEVLNYEIDIQGYDDLYALFQMTPYYWKTSMEGKECLKKRNSLKTQAQFSIEVYKKDM